MTQHSEPKSAHPNPSHDGSKRDEAAEAIMCTLTQATDERGLLLASDWHGMPNDVLLHAARTLVDKLPHFGYRVQKTGVGEASKLNIKQASLVYNSFFVCPVVGCDAEGNEVGPTTQALSFAHFLEVPPYIYPSMMAESRAKAVDFLRDLADKIEKAAQ